jgi:hypothetical protein
MSESRTPTASFTPRKKISDREKQREMQKKSSEGESAMKAKRQQESQEHRILKSEARLQTKSETNLICAPDDISRTT